MKISVITLQAVPNYGSVLQAFATQKKLEEHGCEVEIINYVRENAKYKYFFKNRANSIVKKIVLIPTFYKYKKVFPRFCLEYLNLTKKLYSSKDDFEQYELTADGYCTGSDQVWNSKWNQGIIPELYLSFIPPEKYKFSLAASFGQDYIENNEIQKTIKYIHQYNRISVREKKAQTIIQEQYNYDNSIQLVDPTLMLKANIWRKYAGKKKNTKDYILIYNLNYSKQFDKYALKLAKKTGLKLIRLCTRWDQIVRNGKSIVIPEIFDFISLIDNAKYVLTDSFHATAFSLNLNTMPICIYPDEFGNRIDNILLLTDTIRCHVNNWSDFSILDYQIDFNYVNKILDKERKKADLFIDTIINDIKNANS